MLKTSKLEEIHAIYDAQRTPGINPLAPRKGYYKVTGIYKKYLNGCEVTIAQGNWKLNQYDTYLFNVEFILDSLIRNSNQSISAFDKDVIGKIIHISSTCQTTDESGLKYIVEWQFEIDSIDANLEYLNNLLRTSPDALEGYSDEEYPEYLGDDPSEYL